MIDAKAASLYREYFASNRGAKRAEYTHKNFIAPFVRWIAGEPVTPQALMQWRQSLSKSRSRSGLPGRPAITRAPASRNRHLGAVKAFLNWARKMQLVKISKDTIYDTLEPFPVGQKPPEPLSESQIEGLLVSSVQNDQRARVRGVTRFIVLSLFLGARPGEVRSLKWSHIDWGRQLVTIPEPKNDRVRVVPMDSPMLDRFLRAWHAQDGGDPEARIAQMADKINPKRFEDTFKGAKLEGVTPKVLRTTAVAFYASAKSGLEAEYLIEARFGHSGPVSKRYYRQPLWEVRGRGPFVENFYGPKVVRELERVLERENAKVLGG